MAWTRKKFIIKAFEKLGLAAYTYDLGPEQLQSAAVDCDLMVAGWDTQGIRIGYPISNDPDNIDINADVNVFTYAAEAIINNLAQRIAPSYGRVVAPELKALANEAFSNMADAVIGPVLERSLPGSMPRGAGTKYWRNYSNPFITPTPPSAVVGAGEDGPLNFE